MASIAGVKGAQIVPGTPMYDDHRYQYATSTYGEERDLSPALIVAAANKDDIVRTLKYAKDKKIAVAIKSGGHQYSGASSCGAPNIQLDLGDTFKGPDDRKYWEKDGKAWARVSVSWSLGDFNAWLASHKAFIPHGQCTHVHIGGHVQSGGYGQLSRSFGLFGDHVTSLEIIDSDGQSKEVTKTSDADLFWALLGGSPGNLGVITHFTVQVYRDQDYHGARGMRALYFYDQPTLERLLGLLAEMSDDDKFPRNYDFCVSVLSSSFPLMDIWPELDGLMARHKSKFYGKDGILLYPRTIIVYAQWVPFAKEDRCDLAWFDRIKAGSDWLLAENGVEEKPMSTMTGDWIFRNTREFPYPYVKRTYVTSSRTLARDRWPQWASRRVDAVVKPEANRLWVSAQFQCFGGRNSMLARNAGNGTSYSWRDVSVGYTLDAFYGKGHRDRAEDFQKVNDLEALGPSGVFSKQDRRWLWGSWGNWDMDAVWNNYHESREKYERLQAIRKRADPYGVFTPNPFCVKRAA